MTTENKLEVKIATAFAEDDLIDDRSIEAFGDDRFNHDEFADELSSLALTVRTPSNIAVFAPWGSGKSGLRNLVASRLSNKKVRDISQDEVVFCTFDAFKFGEDPLRKHFISETAKSLLVPDHDPEAPYTKAERKLLEPYVEGLYTDTTDDEFAFDKQKFWPLLGSFLLIIFAVAMVLTIPASLYALAAGKRWTDVMLAVLVATLPVATTVGLFLKVVMSGFTVKSVRQRPTGEEEFERKFRDLLAEGAVRGKRVVIFIDELDRCAANKVVAALEALKTFLDVNRCVCIVAADRNVLERALREKIHQETPADTNNPYFSEGSSFLDKIFQYQLSLPPLRIQAATDFAVSQVAEKKGGIWESLPDLGSTVSILVPYHVQNPRRIKVLLNRFALAYRLANRNGNTLDGDLAERADELAKLVCLQCEFPLFADALESENRLPSLVLFAAKEVDSWDPSDTPTDPRWIVEKIHRAAEKSEEFRWASEPDVSLAWGFASGEAAAATTITRTAPDDANGTEVAIRKARRDLLTEYLNRTEHVGDPGADLVFLASSGDLFELEPSLAATIERASFNRRPADVLIAMESLSEEEKLNAVRFVSSLARSKTSYGVERANAISTLLTLVREADLDLAPAANDIAFAISGSVNAKTLRDHDRVGAIQLARISKPDIAQTLLKAALADPEKFETVDGLGAEAVRASDIVPAGLRGHIGEALAIGLRSESDEISGEMTQALFSLGDEAASKLVETSSSELVAPNMIVTLVEGDEQTEESFDLAIVGLNRLVNAAHDRGAPDVLRATKLAAVNSENSELVGIGDEFLADLSPISNQSIIHYVLNSSASRETFSELADLLSMLDRPTVLKVSPGGASSMTMLREIDSHLGGELDAEVVPDIERVLDQILEFADAGVPIDFESVFGHWATDLQEPVWTPELVETRNAQLANLELLFAREMLDERSISEAMFRSAVATTGAAVNPGDVPRIGDLLMGWVTRYAPTASSSELNEFWAGMKQSGWLGQDEPLRNMLLIQTDAERARREEALSGEFSAEQIQALRAQGFLREDAFALWISKIAISPSDIWTALAPIAQAQPSDAVLDAVRTRLSAEGGDARKSFVDVAVTASKEQDVHESILQASWNHSKDQERVARRLTEIAEGVTDATVMRRIIRVWIALGPTQQRTKDLLRTKVMQPFIRTGAEGTRAVVDSLASIAAVASREQGLVIAEELRSHGYPDPDEQASIEAKVKEVGWVKRTGILGGLLGN